MGCADDLYTILYIAIYIGLYTDQLPCTRRIILKPTICVLYRSWRHVFWRSATFCNHPTSLWYARLGQLYHDKLHRIAATGHALTRWLGRPYVNRTQGCVLPTSRPRRVRKREEVNRARKICLRKKVELYSYSSVSWTTHLCPNLTIINYNLLCGFLARHPLRVSSSDWWFIWLM